MSKQILIIEDNQDISNLVSMHLRDNSFTVQTAYDGLLGLEMALAQDFDLIVLDLMLPNLDGLEICKQLRQQEKHTPILMLTAKSSELDRVIGLEIGADDYLTKPFSIQELIARVKAIFRRIDSISQIIQTQQDNVITVGSIIIDADHHSVTQDGKGIELTAKEFDLLWYFAKHPGRVYTRSQLLDQVWGYGHDGYEHTVNSHINRLRSKIETDPAHPEFILTVWGVGYKFANNMTESTAELQPAC